MDQKRLKAHELAEDIQSGMGHQELMDKYGLSSETLQTFYEDLVGRGLVDRARIEAFSLEAEHGASGVSVCPKCGFSQPGPFAECPVCGIVVEKYDKAHHGLSDRTGDHGTAAALELDETDDDSVDDEPESPARSEDEKSGGVIDHIIDWISDTTSDIAETVSEWTSGAGESSTASESSDSGLSSGDSGGDSGGSGGDTGGNGGGGGDGGGNGGGGD